MAMIDCKECGQSISSKAASCPNCGYVNKKQKKGIGLGGLIVILIAVSFVYTSVTGSRVEEKRQQQAQQKIAEFQSNKNSITANIRTALDNDNPALALTLAEPYSMVKDADFVSLYNEAKEQALVVKVKAIPASEVEENLNIYKELVTLNPSNQNYKAKVTHYQAKVDRIQQIEKQFSSWDGSHYELEKYVKSKLKNPDSYEHVSTRYADKGDFIYLELTYRATNSFNAVVTDVVTAKSSIDGLQLTILTQ